MIVITGPGRSGTSFLARVYQELGFNPVLGGGRWDQQIKGGLEDAEVGRFNARLVNELGMRSSTWRLSDTARRLRAATRVPDYAVGGSADHGTEQASRTGSLVTRVAAGTTGRHLRMLKWDRVPAIVERHGAEIRRLASSRQVVKDPAFCQTLLVWAAAGANIEHVIVSVRALDATVEGLVGMGQLPVWARPTAESQVAYRLGLLLVALTDHRLPYSVLRFPDFLEDADALYEGLRFPEPVTRERWLDAFSAIRQPELVSSWK